MDIETEKFPNLARLISMPMKTAAPMTNGGTVKTKKHREYKIRLLDWSRTFAWMLDVSKIPELDDKTKQKIKTILETTVLPYLERLKSLE
jgi:hypothetical protein